MWISYYSSFLFSGLYFLSMIVMGCISLMATVIILRVYHYPPSQPVPPLLRYISNIGQANSMGADGNTLSRSSSHSDNLHGVVATSRAFALFTAGMDSESAYGSSTSRDSSRDYDIDKDEKYEKKVAAEWHRIAFFLDRVTFVVLLLCLIAVFLFIFVEYLLYNLCVKVNGSVHPDCIASVWFS